MRKFWRFRALPIAVTIACVWLGCGVQSVLVNTSPSITPRPMTPPSVTPLPPPLKYFENLERVAGEGESEIVVFMSKNQGNVRVIIDGRNRLRLYDGNPEATIVPDGMHSTVIVPDGMHKIYANRPKSIFGAGVEKAVTVYVSKSRIVLMTKLDTDGNATLNKYLEIPLDGSKIPTSKNAEPVNKNKGLEAAIKMVISSLINKLPNNSRIAVVYVESDNSGVVSLVIDEIEFYLVSSSRFKIIDRNRLDVIIREQKFQTSGAVSDEQVVQIGAMSGANVVITGSVIKSDNTNRLSVKALDVKTGQIIAMARESY